MKLRTVSVLAFALLSATLAAYAQDSESPDSESGVRPHRARAVHHPSSYYRRHGESRALAAPVYPAPEVSSPAGRPLPSVFRNCEEPAPWWCTYKY